MGYLRINLFSEYYERLQWARALNIYANGEPAVKHGSNTQKIFPTNNAGKSLLSLNQLYFIHALVFSPQLFAYSAISHSGFRLKKVYDIREVYPQRFYFLHSRHAIPRPAAPRVNRILKLLVFRLTILP